MENLPIMPNCVAIFTDFFITFFVYCMRRWCRSTQELISRIAILMLERTNTNTNTNTNPLAIPALKITLKALVSTYQS
jgi:hypothetical protein